MSTNNYHNPERQENIGLNDVFFERVRAIRGSAAEVANVQALQKRISESENTNISATNYWNDNVRQIRHPEQTMPVPDTLTPQQVGDPTLEQIARQDALRTYEDFDNRIPA